MFALIALAFNPGEDGRLLGEMLFESIVLFLKGLRLFLLDGLTEFSLDRDNKSGEFLDLSSVVKPLFLFIDEISFSKSITPESGSVSI